MRTDATTAATPAIANAAGAFAGAIEGGAAGAAGATTSASAAGAADTTGVVHGAGATLAAGRNATALPAAPPQPARLGIIGGSGLYDLPGLADTRWLTVDTPWGAPSDQIFVGRLGSTELAFLPRHGRGHRIPPGEVNYRANIAALKMLGVTDVLSLSAVGSLRADLPPGTFVVVDQFIDRTHGRASSFFGSGCVAHVSLADPVCARLGSRVQALLQRQAVPHVRGGTYLAIEGPQFSTRAESALYRSWNCSVIGMTNMPEAKLAREAELCYCSVSMVTDFDCWHAAHDAVTVDAVIAMLLANAGQARALVAGLAGLAEGAPAVGPAAAAAASADAANAPNAAGATGATGAIVDAGKHCSCRRSLDNALMTAPSARDPALVERLRAIAGRVLPPLRG